MPLASISVTTLVSDTVAGLDCAVQRFETGSGLQITPATPVSSSDFSGALLFRLDTVTGYRRVRDLRINTSDNGLHVFNGALRNPPGADTNNVVSNAANEYAQVVFTRRGADKVTRGYVDGVERIVFTDTGGTVLESDASNNGLTLVAGGLPPPAKVTAAAADNNPFIFVDWVQTRFDPRIAGWRVYRSENGQAWAPVGSTFVDGWVDVTAEYGKGYLYRVASYDAYGNESPQSASMAAAGPSYTNRSVFIPSVKR